MTNRQYKQLQVRPNLPPELQPLEELAMNFWFSWHPSINELFESIDLDLWSKSQNNPCQMLLELGIQEIEKLQNNKNFITRLHTVHKEMLEYLKEGMNHVDIKYPKGQCIAYFCAEFGLHESFPNYSGGLGILAGDHIKTASDLRMPLVAVGLLYRYGYFTQYLNPEGWQQEEYSVIDTFSKPLQVVTNEDGSPLLIEVDFPGRVVYAQAWKAEVGRIKLYLLDTNLHKNTFEDRKITDRLYTGQKENRIQQELLLGVGGVRLLKNIDMYPTVLHMNEGHSAFSCLERTRHYIDNHNLTYSQASELVKASTIFTTHTPVPAGNEEFSNDLVQKYLTPFMETFKMNLTEFLNLGRIHTNEEESFGLTPFCIRSSAYTNGVSRLHGQVSHNLWKDIWPELYLNEIPIDHVTNGVHVPTWIADEFSRLFNRYVDPEWNRKIGYPEVWERISSIPDNELWKSQERLKDRLIGFIRQRARQSLVKRNAPLKEVDETDNLLNADALTIGFARRFATYKRATLLFKDKDRLKKLINSHDRPVQFVFAGKAHPADNEGKKLIESIIHLSREEGFKNRVVFLEDYDLEIARYIVQGVDVWLNTPERLNEACGTSGMKVAINGGINISVPDGWWDEAYPAEIGWTIGKGESYEDLEHQDFVESQTLYDLLENSVIKAYYERGPDNLPKKWISLLKSSLKYCLQHFNSERMLIEYLSNYYTPATKMYQLMTDNGFEKLREYDKWLSKVKQAWSKVRIVNFGSTSEFLNTGDKALIEAKVHLNGMSSDDVLVSLCYGKENQEGKIIYSECAPMKFTREESGKFIFQTSLTPDKGGQYHYTVRVLPTHTMTSRHFEPGYIKWA